MRSVRGRGAGRGAPPVAFGSVAWNGARSPERLVRDLTGGARGGPAPRSPYATAVPFFSIPLALTRDFEVSRARLCRALDVPSARQRASNHAGAAGVSVRRRGSGGIGGAERAERASTARAPG